MKVMNKAIVVLALSVIGTPVLADQVWTWTGLGSPDPSWTEALNWHCSGECPSTFPDSDQAEVTIPDTPNDPVVTDLDARNGYSVKTLTLKSGALLTIPVGDCFGNFPCMGLFVDAHDGLKLEGTSKIEINGGYLQLSGGGKLDIASGAMIEFTGANGRLRLVENTMKPYAPLYEIPGGSSAVVIKGTAHGIIETGRGSGSNVPVGAGPATLVLWDREITGDLDISGRLINNGRVVADGSTEEITLQCQPKSGSGLWLIDGGKIVVNVPVTGTPQSIIHLVSGTLELHDFWVTGGSLSWTGGSITTDAGVALKTGEYTACSQ
jgi:hypothetical protein